MKCISGCYLCVNVGCLYAEHHCMFIYVHAFIRDRFHHNNHQDSVVYNLFPYFLKCNNFKAIVLVHVLQCLPLWPESSTVKLCVRVVGSESTSKSFYFNKQDNGTLLGMDVVSSFCYEWEIIPLIALV